MTRLSKKVLRGIEAEAMRLKNIYEAPNPEVDSIVESLRKEVELNKKRGIDMNEIPTEKLLPQGLQDMLNAKRECMAQANDIHNEIIDREIGRGGNIMKKTVKITTCMRGLQKWIDANPRKNLRGFFTVNGRDMSHNEVKRIVAYAVSKGYETERDIPSEELAELLDK